MTFIARDRPRPWVLTVVAVTALGAVALGWWMWDQRSNAGVFSIALATLEDDETGQYGQRLTDALQGFPSLRLVRVGRIPAADSASPDQTPRTGHDAARRVLTRARADAIVWGSVVREDGDVRVQLNWTPAFDLPIVKQFGRYESAEDHGLPPLLWPDVEPVLRLLVATYVVDLQGLEARAAADQFFPFVVPVYDTLAKPSEGPWSAAIGARVAPVLAQALFRYAEQTRQNQILGDAVPIYRDVLATYARWQHPLEWARAESQLGAALATMGEWTSDASQLEQAVYAFRAALWEQSPDQTPLEWAQTQMRLGTTLTTLATLAGQKNAAPRLEEAVLAYRAASLDETRRQTPLAWAAMQNDLGNALKALGDLKASPVRMEEAVTAYRAALTVATRKRMPRQWATMQSNLASALVRLGESRSNPALLKEAVAAYRAALKERPREEIPLVWAATQNNLGNALRILGQLESDASQMQMAADAYTAALAEFTRAKSDPQVETTRRNLERTLKTLTERGKS